MRIAESAPASRTPGLADVVRRNQFLESEFDPRSLAKMAGALRTREARRVLSDGAWSEAAHGGGSRTNARSGPRRRTAPPLHPAADRSPEHYARALWPEFAQNVASHSNEADSHLRRQSLTEIHGDAGFKRKIGTRSELAKVVSKEAVVEAAQNEKNVCGSFCSVDFLYPSHIYAKRAAPLRCVDRRQPAYIDTFAHSRVHFRGLGVRRSERSRPTSVV